VRLDSATSVSQGTEGGFVASRLCSDEFGPVVIGHHVWACPLFAIDVGARAVEEAVLSVLEHGDPG
jgi:hypothetical protein